MAPVTAPGLGGRDRAQLIVIGAFALAVSLVALALVLNTAIYTHNLASRGNGGATESAQFLPQAERGAGSIVENVNAEHAGEPYTDLTTTHYETQLGNWSDAMARGAATNSQLVSVAPASSSPTADVEGVRIADDADGGSPFQPAFGTPSDWLVATDVRLRNYAGTVNRTDTATVSSVDLALDPLNLNAFVAEFVDADGDTWQVALYVHDTDNRVTAKVERPNGNTLTCSAPGETVRFDLTSGLLGNEPCQAFSFVERMDGLVDVHYYNGDQVEGQYSLVVDRTVASESTENGSMTHPVDVANVGTQCDGPTYETASSAGTGTPYVSPAIYAVDVQVSHRNPAATYEGRLRVAPHEPGDRPQTPALTELVVTDATGGDGTFEVEWDTRDPNGDTVDITIDVSEPDTSGTFDRSGSGSEAFTVGDDGDTSEEYDITLTATDGSNSRSVTVTHLDDGDDSGCPP